MLHFLAIFTLLQTVFSFKEVCWEEQWRAEVIEGFEQVVRDQGIELNYECYSEYNSEFEFEYDISEPKFHVSFDVNSKDDVHIASKATKELGVKLEKNKQEKGTTMNVTCDYFVSDALPNSEKDEVMCFFY